ncbi:MAG: extracellular solute-binding protein [Anaerolineales bacterium]|nr:extracellular solute-binding protein [Anaerolineales bacterium]
MHRFLLPSLLALALLLAACASPLPASPNATPLPSDPLDTEATPASQPTSSQGAAVSLTVWVPPRFDPGSGSLAAHMLQARLEEFNSQHPQLRLEVRVKSESSPGRMLEALLAAKAAAPLALPDLVLLPHSQLAEAATSEVVLPVGPLTNSLDSSDWYDFGRQMAEVDGQAYGLPFAADALVLAYRPTALEQVPDTWSDLLNDRLALGFSAADPQANFILSQLLSLPDEPTPPFSRSTLSPVLEFFANGREAGVFPFWLTQYETNEQGWSAFTEGRVPMLATWTSRVFDSRNVDVQGAPLPTADGRDVTVMRGWVWAISTVQVNNLGPATELAEFLTQAEFMAQWTAAAGLLPPRQSSLAAWSPDARQTLASQIVGDAVALPQESVAVRWGAALSQAVIALLKQEVTPEDALQGLLEEFAQP